MDRWGRSEWTVAVCDAETDDGARWGATGCLRLLKRGLAGEGGLPECQRGVTGAAKGVCGRSACERAAGVRVNVEERCCCGRGEGGTTGCGWCGADPVDPVLWSCKAPDSGQLKLPWRRPTAAFAHYLFLTGKTSVVAGGLVGQWRADADSGATTAHGKEDGVAPSQPVLRRSSCVTATLTLAQELSSIQGAQPHETLYLAALSHTRGSGGGSSTAVHHSCSNERRLHCTDALGPTHESTTFSNGVTSERRASRSYSAQPRLTSTIPGTPIQRWSPYLEILRILIRFGWVSLRHGNGGGHGSRSHRIRDPSMPLCTAAELPGTRVLVKRERDRRQGSLFPCQ